MQKWFPIFFLNLYLLKLETFHVYCLNSVHLNIFFNSIDKMFDEHKLFICEHKPYKHIF